MKNEDFEKTIKEIKGASYTDDNLFKTLDYIKMYLINLEMPEEVVFKILGKITVVVADNTDFEEAKKYIALFCASLEKTYEMCLKEFNEIVFLDLCHKQELYINE